MGSKRVDLVGLGQELVTQGAAVHKPMDAASYFLCSAQVYAGIFGLGRIRQNGWALSARCIHRNRFSKFAVLRTIRLCHQSIPEGMKNQQSS